MLLDLKAVATAESSPGGPWFQPVPVDDRKGPCGFQHASHRLNKYYSINEYWAAEDRRKLLSFARDLLNSGYAGHRLADDIYGK